MHACQQQQETKSQNESDCMIDLFVPDAAEVDGHERTNGTRRDVPQEAHHGTRVPLTLGLLHHASPSGNRLGFKMKIARPESWFSSRHCRHLIGKATGCCNELVVHSHDSSSLGTPFVQFVERLEATGTTVASARRDPIVTGPCTVSVQVSPPNVHGRKNSGIGFVETVPPRDACGSTLSSGTFGDPIVASPFGVPGTVAPPNVDRAAEHVVTSRVTVPRGRVRSGGLQVTVMTAFTLLMRRQRWRLHAVRRGQGHIDGIGAKT